MISPVSVLRTIIATIPSSPGAGAVPVAPGSGPGPSVGPCVGSTIRRRLGVGVRRRLGVGVRRRLGIGVRRRLGIGVRRRLGVGVRRLGGKKWPPLEPPPLWPPLRDRLLQAVLRLLATCTQGRSQNWLGHTTLVCPLHH